MPAVAGDPIRIGILGCADIARRRFIPALLNSRSASFAAVASREPARLQPFVTAVNVPLLRYQECISAPDIDLVYIALPNHLHEEWAIKSLELGKHVLCEKPLGLSAASIKRMLAAADPRELLLFENLMYLQHPLHDQVEKIIASGRIGPLRSLRAVFTIPDLTDGNFRMNPAMGGGAFHDLNRYPCSAALHFLKGKHHRFIRGSAGFQGDLNIALEGETITDAGEQFSFEMAFGRPYQSSYEIGGEAGFIRVERAFTMPAEMENVIMVHAGGRDEQFRVPPCDHFLATIDHVCRLIRAGSFAATHEKTGQLAALAETIYSGCTGAVIPIQDQE